MEAVFEYESETEDTIQFKVSYLGMTVGVLTVQKWALKLVGSGDYPKSIKLEMTKED